MGVSTFSDEFASPVPPAKLFKSMVLDIATLYPKLLPQQVKSVENIKGNGEPGSIMQITFQDGGGFPVKQLKRKVEAVDVENFSTKTSTTEGSNGNIEKTVTEVQFQPSPDGGSIIKTKTTYYTKGGEVINEEDVKVGKEFFLAYYKAVEAYLLQNNVV